MRYIYKIFISFSLLLLLSACNDKNDIVEAKLKILEKKSINSELFNPNLTDLFSGFDAVCVQSPYLSKEEFEKIINNEAKFNYKIGFFKYDMITTSGVKFWLKKRQDVIAIYSDLHADPEKIYENRCLQIKSNMCLKTIKYPIHGIITFYLGEC
ncbi:hypothetical protein [Stenoxybacter acetivorans]|uniref:hypothetical protein n=1 Tax=Stenoxybacter acetivorans TaxID=422441 RepID=UPI00055F7C99|nr:hypothetical protein [Stenoxybacter acetivorans]